MELKEKTADELLERRTAIAAELDSPEADLDALEEEVRAINAELEARKAAEAKKAELRQQVAKGEGEVTKKVEEAEGRKEQMTIEEIRASKEYTEAFARYLKSEDPTEIRALLTENGGGGIPVPVYVEGRIRTAWERLGIMNLVRKTYVKGNLKVGFEVTGDPAVIHTEGADAINPENLTIGVVQLVPQTIKKLVQVSDEVLDMQGEEFLDYIYDEITYKIAKKAEDILIGLIVAAGTSATTGAVSVASITSNTASLDLVAQGISAISDEAANPVVVMNKGTYAAFKAAQYAANYGADPFEGLEVYFNNSLPAFANASSSATWLIIGDFGVGAQANFPNGDEIRIKFDDLTNAAADLVNVVGREAVAIGLVADKAFAKVVKG